MVDRFAALRLLCNERHLKNVTGDELISYMKSIMETVKLQFTFKKKTTQTLFN